MKNTTAPTFGEETLPFEATVFELQQVARYWTQYSWNAQLFRVYSGWTSVSDSLKLVYADKRLTQIRKAIGENAFHEVKDEIDAEIRKQIGEEDWAAITGSDEAAYERLLERIDAEQNQNGEEIEAVARLVSSQSSPEDAPSASKPTDLA